MELIHLPSCFKYSGIEGKVAPGRCCRLVRELDRFICIVCGDEKRYLNLKFNFLPQSFPCAIYLVFFALVLLHSFLRVGYVLPLIKKYI